MIDKKLQDILICPICKGNIEYLKEKKKFFCSIEKKEYNIYQNIPIMLI